MRQIITYAGIAALCLSACGAAPTAEAPLQPVTAAPAASITAAPVIIPATPVGTLSDIALTGTAFVLQATRVTATPGQSAPSNPGASSGASIIAQATQFAASYQQTMTANPTLALIVRPTLPLTGCRSAPEAINGSALQTALTAANLRQSFVDVIVCDAPASVTVIINSAVTNLNDQAALGNLAAQILTTLGGSTLDGYPQREQVVLNLKFHQSGQQQGLLTPYLTALAQARSGITGAALLTALGGLSSVR